MAWFRDMRQLDAVHTVEMEPVLSGSSGDYSLVQRLQLLSVGNSIDTQSVSFSTGIQYNEETAIENARTQIDRLYALGILPFGSSNLLNIGIDMVAYTVDSGNPLCSVMEWVMPVNFDNGYTGFLNMDDDTGLICSIALWIEDESAEPAVQLWAEGTMETYAEAWAKYLGLAVMDGEPLAVTAKQAKVYYEEKGIELYDDSSFGFAMDSAAAAGNAAMEKENAIMLQEKYGIYKLDVFLSDGLDAVPYQIYAEPEEFWQISIL